MKALDNVLQELIIRKDINYIDKQSDRIGITFKNGFGSKNAYEIIEILKGYKWDIETQYSPKINLYINEDSYL